MKLFPGELLETKMDVSWSLSAELLSAYHFLSMLDDTKAIVFPTFASSWDKKLWEMRSASKITVTPGWICVKHT